MYEQSGLDCLGAEPMSEVVIGFDWMNIAKGAAGALSGAGDILSSKDDKKGGGKDDVKAALAQQKLEDDKRKAESSALTMKIILGGVIGLGAMTGIALLVRR